MIFTNHEALKSTVNYPVADATLLRIMVDRMIDPNGRYQGKTEAFELANADLLVHWVTSADITEGGYRVSLSEKQALMSIAYQIYERYSVPVPEEIKKPEIRNRSNYW